MKVVPALQQFVKRNQLELNYLTHAEQWFSPIIAKIYRQNLISSTPLVIGINGCQGSGKSTLADYFSTCLNNDYGLNVAVLSLDDFYYSKQQRRELADQIHPLLATRGVPGTHDISLAINTLDKLCAGPTNDDPVALPRFNKFNDNPYPEQEWPVINQKLDVIILEGWCLGAQPQATNALIYPVNKLEASLDKQGIWRSYVNQQLKQNYQEFFNRIDYWIMLKAPSFNNVHQWRLEQESKMESLQYDLSVDVTVDKIMSSNEVKKFIAYFQRITEHCLVSLPAECDWVFQLDDKRNIVDMS